MLLVAARRPEPTMERDLRGFVGKDRVVAPVHHQDRRGHARREIDRIDLRRHRRVVKRHAQQAAEQSGCRS